MDQRKLDFSSSAFGINCDGSGRQLLGLYSSRRFRSFTRGIAAFLLIGTLAGCIAPDGTISFDSSFMNNPGYSGPGALMTSFGNQGNIQTSQMFLNFGSKGMAVDSQGRMLVPGFILQSSTTNFAVGRFTPDGSIDPSFGTNGVATFVYNSSNVEKATSVILDPGDQSVVVGGMSFDASNGTRAAVIQKLTANGQPPVESAFNSTNPSNTSQMVFTTGVSAPDLNDDSSGVSLVAAPNAQPGSGVSTGYFAAYSMPSISYPNTNQMTLVHIQGSNETVPSQMVEPIEAGSLHYAYDLEISPLCTPTALSGGSCPVVVIGNDATTGGTGNLLIWNLDYVDGTYTNNNETQFKVSNIAGSLDTPRTSMFDPVTGNLLITGYSSLDPSSGSNGDGPHVFFLIRVAASANYQLDPTFGNQGYGYNPFTVYNSAGFSITEDNQSRILIGGGFTGGDGEQGAGLDQVVLRYLPAGFLDPTFGPFNGIAPNTLIPSDAVATGVYYDPVFDRILTAGFCNANTEANNGANDGGILTFSAYQP